MDVFITTIVIILARIVDVTLGTLRLLSVVRGIRGLAFVLGLFEALVWVFAISKVYANLDQPLYMIAFALGFAIGNFVGLTLERRLAFGSQMARIFTRHSCDITPHFRNLGFGVTNFRGEGKDGPVDMLLVKAQRRKMPALLRAAKEHDPHCFYIVDEVTLSSEPNPKLLGARWWRNQALRK
ncbi:MAG: DUF2179 domain-containing protein [Bdellovibrionales bacterium]|nr:DUF2179 domain-containing protein [Bdellovibrionales bacterium]